MKNTHRAISSLFVLILTVASASTARGATIVIVNNDPPGFGFNDATAVAPVGGNAGTTLGQQRLNVFQAAADIWGARLNSAITIRIGATWEHLTPCSTGFGVLGSAGPTAFNRDFTNAPRASTWYPVALASALAGSDLASGAASIDAQFNVDVGTAGCLPSGWYLGLDGNHLGQIDLETVLLHEFGHGLGFIGLADPSTGTLSFDGNPDIFSHFIFDNTSLLHWDVMSNVQRQTSALNTGNVVFDGSNVITGVTSIPLTAGKDGSNHAKLYAPNPVELGSSVYHFDTTASPNLIMEPAINGDLTHAVDLPTDLTTSAMADLGWPLAAAYNPPTNVVATATSGTSVNLTWTAASGTAPGRYNVYRSADGTNYSLVGNTTGTALTNNTGLTANTSYLYMVRSAAADGTNESSDSNRDLATTAVYTHATLTAGSSVVSAADLNELRVVVDAVRTLYGIGAGFYSFGSITAGSSLVHAADISELRTNLNTALTGLGLSTPTYTNPTITGGTSVIKAVDFNELRTAVR